jgi:hypothetical protein
MLVACAHAHEPSRVSEPGLVEGGTIVHAANTPPRGGVHLEIEQVEGATASELRAIFQPALEPVRRCLAGSAGKLNVRLTNRSGGLEISVAPGESLSPTARACVLEALTAVYLEATGANVGGPGLPPSGFTSLVSVSW